MQYYLDNNATTPMCEEAINAMDEVHRTAYGNASSVHLMGAEARKLLEAARESLAGMIGCEPGELYFTSGGTEANNWALRGILENRPELGIIHSAVEHKSILKTCNAMTFQRSDRIAVDEDGIVDIDNLETVLRRRCCDYLVSVMLANNETGVIQPIPDVVSLLRETRPDSLIHVDAVQAFGKIPVNVKDLDVDLMTISAHKLGGPAGIGALYVRKGVEIAPMIVGGHQEGDLRAGTENVAAAVGFQVAALQRDERRRKSGEYIKAVCTHVANLRYMLAAELDNIWINGGGCYRLPNTVNIGFEGVDSDALVLMLSAHGVFVSNGSACEAGSDEGSHVLRAMGQDDEKSRSAIRFSFSDDLPEGAIQEIANYVISTVKLLRDMNKIDIPDSIA